MKKFKAIFTLSSLLALSAVAFAGSFHNGKSNDDTYTDTFYMTIYGGQHQQPKLTVTPGSSADVKITDATTFTFSGSIYGTIQSADFTLQTAAGDCEFTISDSKDQSDPTMTNLHCHHSLQTDGQIKHYPSIAGNYDYGLKFKPTSN